MGPKDILNKLRSEKEILLVKARWQMDKDMFEFIDSLKEICNDEYVSVEIITANFAKTVSSIGHMNSVSAQLGVIETTLLRFD